MKYGYGYEREPQALLDAGAERLFIDHATSGREQRAELFGRVLQAGDVLVLLDRRDLGGESGIKRYEAWAYLHAVTVEIVPTTEKTRIKPGRKSGFNPTPEQESQCRHWWISGYKRRIALQQIEMIMGQAVSPDQLNRRFGPRGGGKLK